MTKAKVATNAQKNGQLEFNKSKVPYIGLEVRYAKDGDEIFFVAKDIADVLGYEHTPHMVRRLDDDERGVRLVDTPSGTQEMTVITESGFYSAVLGSNKPEAKEFKRWVTKELLPSIRRNGVFVSDQATPEQIEWLVENAIVEKLIKASKGSRVVIGNLVKKILDTHDVRYFHRKTYPYILQQLTNRKRHDAKDIMFDRLIEPIREWGNAIYKRNKLQLTDQYDIMALLKTLEEDQSTFLSRSRGQITKHCNKLKAKANDDCR